jgi:hypothetical protein
MKIGKSDSIRLLGGFHKVHKIWRSTKFARSIGEKAAAAAVAASSSSDNGAPASEEKFPTPPAQSLRQKEIGERTADVASIATARAAVVPIPMAASFASVQGVVRSEEKGPTSPAQSLRQEEIGEKTAAADVASTAAAVPTPMAASSASFAGADGNQEKGPTSPRGGGSLRAVFVLTVVAVAVTIFLLAHFHGDPMPQVWILSLSICSYVFFFLLFISRSRSFYTNFYRLSYGPVLAFCSVCGIGSATATFVLFFSMAWASGNFGYSLALHSLRKGTETSIRTVPRPSRPTKGTIRGFNATLYNLAPTMVLLWTLVMAFFVNVTALTDELYILMTLSYFGWILVAGWLIIVTLAYMHEFPLKEAMGWLVPALLIWMTCSPAICLVSQMLAVLCHLLLMMALVAFLWYNLAIYIHFLETGTPRYAYFRANYLNMFFFIVQSL